EERLLRIDKVLNDYVSKKWVPGAVALIVKDGKVVYHKAAGYDDVVNKTPLKKDAIFRIASQTKAITSTAIMILYEEGLLLLDDPVSKYIPEFEHPKVLSAFNDADSSYTTVPAKREITLRDLLTHTSGIDYAVIGSKSMNAIYAKASISSGIGGGKRILGNEVRKLAALPLAHQPGEKFTYGLNTDVLGYVVEVVGGLSLDAFFKKRIFQPLGMNDTYFYLPKDKHSRLANLYSEDAQHNIVLSKPLADIFPDYPNSAGTYYSGGAGLSSTAYDYAVFLQMLLNGGTYNGSRILGEASVRMMTMNQIGDIPFGDDRFGLGFRLYTAQSAARSPLSEGSFEWGGYFGTSYWADPKERLVALLFTQFNPNSHGELDDKFKTLVYQAINN
ncbi:MAG: beta-lactamase family protein, partial [Chitinophagaceae bacterium]|nr:beta-lactamase family protein [Chitinophagaceae bacterium]